MALFALKSHFSPGTGAETFESMLFLNLFQCFVSLEEDSAHGEFLASRILVEVGRVFLLVLLSRFGRWIFSDSFIFFPPSFSFSRQPVDALSTEPTIGKGGKTTRNHQKGKNTAYCDESHWQHWNFPHKKRKSRTNQDKDQDQGSLLPALAMHQ